MKKLLILCCSIFIGFLIISFEPVPKTYYLDALNGNDQNMGTDPSSAWRSLAKINGQIFESGSIILLKCGAVWNGQLILKGSGSAEKPIKLSSYGKGNKPIINGNGQVEQVILLAEVDGWEIENLEITNPAVTVGNRIGILIKSLENGTKKHFRLSNLYIHHVMGDYSFETKGKNTGGIGIIGGPATKFDDIVIENCEISNINRVGIFTNLTKGDQAKQGNRPFRNLIIKNNTINRCAGDGLILRYAFRPLISHNLAYENHNGPENLVKHGVALWCRSTDEAIFEYNEVHHTRGKMDGQAFDADLDSYRTLVQYNYSHDNEGGMMLIYGSSSESIVRHNLSVDDGKKGKHVFDFPIWTSPRGSGIFHNNTIILPKDSAVVIADEALETAKFYQNIFYQQGTGKLVVKSNGKSAYFNANAYYGYTKSELTDSAAVWPSPKKTIPNVAPAFREAKKYLQILSLQQKISGFTVNKLGTDYWLPDFGNYNFWLKPTNYQTLSVGVKNN